jgi:hypothetical protein
MCEVCGTVFEEYGAPYRKQGSKMSRSDSNHVPYNDQPRAKARPEMVMPRLTQAQMLAILRESGVPENEARQWIARDPALILDVSTGEG